MNNFVTAHETARRLSAEHAQLRDQAVEKINALIRGAVSLPVTFPRSLLTDIPVVRWELLRKLKQEAGWDVGDCGLQSGCGPHPDQNVTLDHPTSKREQAAQPLKEITE